MSIFATLTREHRIFERLIGRLENSLSYQETFARSRLREAMLVLVPAINRHEEIEHLLFDNPSYACQKEAKKLLSIIEAQHRKIKSLRRDVEVLLNDADEYVLPRLKSLVLLLIDRLRLHFETEETLLWPHYNSPESRSISRSIDRKTRERVRSLEAEMKEYWAVISDYLGAACGTAVSLQKEPDEGGRKP